MRWNAIAVSVLSLASVSDARCPNGCSGHGACGVGNKCECYPFFQSSDCSQRSCPYERAFIDTPLGDVDGDGTVGMKVAKDPIAGYVIEGYPIKYGLGRQFDGVQESGRWDEGHFYAECSNKGLCNRKTGECECFPGYTGSGCKRTTCPGLTDEGHECNGHGACVKAYDHLSSYHLWDKEKTMKCQCHPAFEGPDCSLRRCMANADPIESKDTVMSMVSKLSFSSFYFPVANLADVGQTINGDVLFSITVTDEWGESWTTNAMTIHYETMCGNPGKDGANSYLDAVCEMSPKLTSTDLAGDEYDPNIQLIADQVNASLKSLANDAVLLPQVWQSYTTTSVAGQGTSVFAAEHKKTRRYPETQDTALLPTDHLGGSGYTEYLNSQRTRFPDFQNDIYPGMEASMYCRGMNADPTLANNPAQYLSQADQTKLTDANILAGEGLCLYISTSSRTSTEYKVNFMSVSNIATFATKADEGKEIKLGPAQTTYAYASDIAGSYVSQTMRGSSTAVSHSTDGTPAVASTLGTALMKFDMKTGVGTPYEGSYACVRTDSAKDEAKDPSCSFSTQDLYTKDKSTLKAQCEAIQGAADGENKDTAICEFQTIQFANLETDIIQVPIITSEIVGHNRYWDVNIDGYPAKSFRTPNVYTCSKRGLCDHTTGLCKCFAGFAGVDCNQQNAISYNIGGDIQTTYEQV